MSDLVRTLESDDEQEQPSASSAPVQTAKKGKGRQQKPEKAKKGQLDLKGKKRAREEDGSGEGDGDGMDAAFQFDALGGGETTSRKYGRRDAWVGSTLQGYAADPISSYIVTQDLNDAIDMFRKKNAPVSRSVRGYA